MLKKYVSKKANKHVAMKTMALAAFMGYSFGGQMVHADNLTWSLDPTLDDGLYTTSTGTSANHSFAVKTADKNGNVSTSYYKINLNPARFSPQSNATYSEVTPEFDEDGNITTQNVIKVSLPNNDTKYYQYTLHNDKTYTTTYENLYREQSATESYNNRNTVLNGGAAIYNPEGTTISVDDALFKNNTSFFRITYYGTSYPRMSGGALYNGGTITNLNADFYGKNGIPKHRAV